MKTVDEIWAEYELQKTQQIELEFHQMEYQTKSDEDFDDDIDDTIKRTINNQTYIAGSQIWQNIMPHDDERCVVNGYDTGEFILD